MKTTTTGNLGNVITRLVLAIGAVSCVLFASCSADAFAAEEPTYIDNKAQSNDNAKSAVSFAAAVENYSRSNAYSPDGGAEGLTADGFGFFAGEGAERVENRHVTLNNGVWGYTPLYYTTTSTTVDAYAPYNSQTVGFDNCFESGATGILFEMSDNPMEQTDLMYGSELTGDTSNITFEHALARLGFSLSVTVNSERANLTLPESTDNADNGTYILPGGARFIVHEIVLRGQFHSSGVLNTRTGEWAVPSENGTYASDSISRRVEVAGNATINSFRFTSENIVSPATLASAAGEENYSAEEFPINNADSYLYLIPQSLRGANALYYQMTYTMDYGETSITETITSDYCEFNLKAGRSYTWHIDLNFETIHFDL